MSAGPSHETPILLLLPPRTTVAAGFATVLTRPEVRHVAWPPLWHLDGHGLDLAAALPDVTTLDLGTLPRVLDALARLAGPEALDAYVARRWREVDARVRDHYLQRSALAVIAGAFGMGTGTRDQAPPPEFRRDRIFEAALPVAYRLARDDEGPWDAQAPPEEGTIGFHPFDAHGHAARAEAGLEEGEGPVLELYAYEGGRHRHRAFAEQLAATQPGWRVVDPLSGDLSAR